MTDVGAFLLIPPEEGESVAPPLQPTRSPAGVNEALVAWLMTAPDTPDETLTLEDFLGALSGTSGPPVVASALAATSVEAIRALCEGCPVRRECLDAALANPDLMGLSGGTTELERKRDPGGVGVSLATEPQEAGAEDSVAPRRA